LNRGPIDYELKLSASDRTGDAQSGPGIEARGIRENVTDTLTQLN
jgi:hypothetical protein